MIFRDLRTKFCSIAYSVVLWPVALTWTPTDIPAGQYKKPIEIFTEGRQFNSVAEYRHYQSLLETRQKQKNDDSPGVLYGAETSVLPQTAEEVIVYLENLSDNELRRLVDELRVRRGELFTKDPLNPYLAEMQGMLDQAHKSGDFDDVKLDPAKIKTVTISSESDKQSPISIAAAKKLFITKDDIHSLDEQDLGPLTESLKQREHAPLAEPGSEARSAAIQTVWVEGAEASNLISQAQAQRALSMIPSLFGAGKLSNGVITGEELKQLLQDTRPQQSESARATPDEDKILTKFLKNPADLGAEPDSAEAAAVQILRDLPDSELKEVLAIFNERRHQSGLSAAVKTLEPEVLGAEGSFKSESGL